MNSREFDELTWHDAVLREVRVNPAPTADSRRGVEVLLDAYVEAGSKTRVAVSIRCSEVVRVTMSASFLELGDNQTAGNVGNLYVKQELSESASSGAKVLWIYLVDGLIEVSAKSIDCFLISSP